jgi:hypothetical protein
MNAFAKRGLPDSGCRKPSGTAPAQADIDHCYGSLRLGGAFFTDRRKGPQEPSAGRYAFSRLINAGEPIMPQRANDNRPVRSPPTADEPDAHGQAALILAESIIHALVETKIITAEKALDVIRSAEEIKTEVAGLAGESETRMNESLELLKRIGISLEKDVL